MNEEHKIKEEIPGGERCCLCFPLRYGLISWGYFKMIVSAFFILVVSYAMLHTYCMMLGYNGSDNLWTRIYADIALTSIALTFFVTDLLLTMLFIVGAHQKNMKLLKAFCTFSIAIWAMTIVLSAMAVGLSIESWLSRYMSLRSLIINLLNFSAYYGIIIVQTYFIILLKIEIVTPRNNGECKFVNKPAEAECTMKCEVKIAGDETDTDDEFIIKPAETECTYHEM